MIRRLSERGGVTGINFYPYFLDEVLSTEVRKPYASIEKMVEHIKHIKNIGGIQCIGLGTDFDGIEGDLEIKDASYMQMLVDGLEKAGFTSTEIEAICYKNVLRVYKEILR
jgi:membrane dipeptidase